MDVRLPRAVLVTAASLLLVNVTMMFAGAVVGGVTIDEPLHVHRLNVFLHDGLFEPPRSFINGHLNPDAHAAPYTFGPVASLLAHVVAVLAGTESWTVGAETAGAYVARHLTIAALACVGLLAVASTGRLLLRSWRWGLLAAAMLSSIPLYTGHAMFNTKDSPVAAGLAVATLGIVALTRPGIRARKVWLLASGSLALGVWLTVGVRPSMVVSIVAGVLVALVASALFERRIGESSSDWVTRSTVALGGLLVGYLALLITYPKLFAHPDRVLAGLTSSSNYPWFGFTLTAGTYMPEHPPLRYLPLWFAAQTPVIVTVLTLGVLAWFARSALHRTALSTNDQALVAGVAVVSTQALFLPTVAVATDATLYTGLRHFGFVMPALAVLTVVGAYLVARQVPRSPRGLRPALAASLIAGMTVPTLSSTALFPYNYTWFNAVAALRPINGNWEVDYKWSSGREAITHIDSLNQDRCTAHDGGPCFKSTLQPYLDTVGSDLPATHPENGYWHIEYSPRPGAPPRPNCHPSSTITRHLYWRTVTMTTIEQCTGPARTTPTDAPAHLRVPGSAAVRAGNGPASPPPIARHRSG